VKTVFSQDVAVEKLRSIVVIFAGFVQSDDYSCFSLPPFAVSEQKFHRLGQHGHVEFNYKTLSEIEQLDKFPVRYN